MSLTHNPLCQCQSCLGNHSSLVVDSACPGKPKAGLYPDTFSFGSVVAGAASVPQVAVLKNEGTADLLVKDIVITGPFDYSIDMAVGGVLFPGSQANITITFKPVANGVVSGSIYLDTDSIDGNEFVLMSGEGIGSGSSMDGYSAWPYNDGSALGGEQDIVVPDLTSNIPFAYLNGFFQFAGYNYTFDPATHTVHLASPLEPEDTLIFMLSGDFNDNTILLDSAAGRVAREALRRTYAEAGYNLVDGSFDTGGTVNTTTDVLLNEVDGKAYSWGGTLPKTVSSDSTPDNSGGTGTGAWQLESNKLLRVDLGTAAKGAKLLATQAPFPNSTIRTQHDKNAEFISIKDFKGSLGETVVGDGVNDDTAGIQSALDVGGFLTIPPGRYKITRTLRIHSNTTLYGLGFPVFSYENPSTDWHDSILLTNGPLNGTADNGGYDNTKNIHLFGLEFDCSVRANLGQMAEHIAFAHHKNLIIEACIFRNYAGNTHAMELNSTKNAVVRNNQFVGYIQNGASLGSREFINIDSSTETGFPTFGPWDGTVCDSIYVYNNEFDGGDVAVGSHASSMTAPHTNIRVYLNTIRNGISFGISAYFWKDSLVNDNYIQASDRGIRLVACTSCSVGNNKLHDCAVIGLQIGYKDAGLNSRDITISNNTLTLCGGSPIEGATDVKLLNNTYMDVTKVGVNVWAIGDTTNITCSGNEFPTDGTMVNKGAYGQALFVGNAFKSVDGTMVFPSYKDTVKRIPIKSIGGQGMVWVYTLSALVSNRPRGLYFYRANTKDSLILTPVIDVATGVDVVTGDLTGTTGTDGAVTLSVIAGYLLIENRVGTVNFAVQFV